VKQAVAGSMRFPALVVDRKSAAVTLYDVADAPPVLRTYPESEVRVQDAAGWTHATVTRSYSDADLNSINAYLKWLAQR